MATTTNGSWQQTMAELLEGIEGNTSGGTGSGSGSEASILNTTSTPLAASGTFTGTSELNDYNDVMVQVATDAGGTLYMEFSVDNVNWDTSLSFNVQPDRINPPHILVKANRYFRVRFVNGADAQTYFRLNTYFGSFQKLTSPINGLLSENYDALAVRPTDYRIEVALGKRQGASNIQKWGYNNSSDNGVAEIVASWGGAFDPMSDIMTSAQTFDITYNNTTDGSGTTGATTLQIQYLDSDFNLQSAIHILGSTGSDTTSFSGLGINRMVVVANGGDGVNGNDITATATTDASIQARIPAGDGVTQQLIYHVPQNHSFFMNDFSINVMKVGGTAPVVDVNIYAYSRTVNGYFNLKESRIDSAIENNLNVPNANPFIFSPKDVIFVMAESNTNGTVVKGNFNGILHRIS